MSAIERQDVLVIDDSELIHALLRVRLQHEAIDLHHAYSAEEGLAAAKAIKPHLILLDVSMPKTSGFELCRILKQDPELVQIPVIFLTGAAGVASKLWGFDVGAVDYVTKPFEPAELRARVRSALRTRKLLQMLEERARIDGLTGLWNRSYFDRRLAEEIAVCNRHDRQLSLVLVDVDHFKRINDTYGHPFGDRVLEAIGRTLEKGRGTDVVFRYGGEEFAVIARHTPLESAMTLADSMRHRIEAMNLTGNNGEPVVVTASFGVAGSEALETPTPAALLAAADAALYVSKREGRNCVRAA
jgi:two-component system, cell cycle response regulator